MALPGDSSPIPYQSLYRRFRPQRFAEVLGQEHISLALHNAVRDERVGHAYLFSGPRGTGKTSTARILAKALNCAAPDGGEPCGVCDSCIEIARGTSLDVHELDAASNNGVDAMRELVSHAALGTPGRWKVYIVDEVHMLSTAASNALLKTLEEPPSHVVFVLATTEAQKVLPTIRSRTQHFEFRLLGPDTLVDLLRRIRDEAGLDLKDDSIDAAVRRGRGSARDALSALDQVAAGGTVDDELTMLAALADALAEHDPGRALVCVAQASEAGHDMAQLAGALADHLRQAFLVSVAPDLVAVPASERAAVDELARKMGLAAVVRHMEVLGKAQVDMREAPDPRVHLEVVLIRLTHPEADDSPAALLERIERLERTQGGGSLADPGTSTMAEKSVRPTGASAPARASPGASGSVPPGCPRRPTRRRPEFSRRRGRTRGHRSRAGPPDPGGPRWPEGTGPQAGGTVRVGHRGSRTRGPAVPGRPPPPHHDRNPIRRLRPPLRLGPTLRQRPTPGRLRRPPPAPAAVAPWRCRGTSSSNSGETGSSPHSPIGPGPGSGWAASWPSRTAPPSSPCRTRRTAPTARTSGPRWRRRWGGISAPPSRSGWWSTPSREKNHGSAPGPLPGSPAGLSPGADDDPGHDPAEPDLLDPVVLAAETQLAGAGLTPEERLKQAFPGAEEV